MQKIFRCEVCQKGMRVVGSTGLAKPVRTRGALPLLQSEKQSDLAARRQVQRAAHRPHYIVLPASASPSPRRHLPSATTASRTAAGTRRRRRGRNRTSERAGKRRREISAAESIPRQNRNRRTAHSAERSLGCGSGSARTPENFSAQSCSTSSAKAYGKYFSKTCGVCCGGAARFRRSPSTFPRNILKPCHAIQHRPSCDGRRLHQIR